MVLNEHLASALVWGMRIPFSSPVVLTAVAICCVSCGDRSASRPVDSSGSSPSTPEREPPRESVLPEAAVIPEVIAEAEPPDEELPGAEPAGAEPPDTEETSDFPERIQVALLESNPRYDGRGTITVLEDGTLAADFSGADLSDISGLKDMPISELKLGGTRVSDLSALLGSPISTLYIDGAEVTDGSQLRDLPLTQLVFSPEKMTKGMDVLRQKRSIVVIGENFANRTSPEYFWIMYDKEH